MSIRGRLAVVVVALLELFVARAAHAGDGVRLVGAKPMRLDLALAWPPPAAPSLIPPAGSAATPSAPATPAAPPIAGASGPQVAMAILMTLVGDIAGVLVANGTDSLWAGAIPWAIAPFGAAALVCHAGTARPGRCRATLAGALIGAALGLLPGMVLIVSAGSRPDLEEPYHTYLQNRLLGFETTFVLYGVGVPTGTIIGYNVGGAAQPNPAQNTAIIPPVATAPIFTLRF